MACLNARRKGSPQGRIQRLVLATRLSPHYKTHLGVCQHMLEVAQDLRRVGVPGSESTQMWWGISRRVNVAQDLRSVGVPGCESKHRWLETFKADHRHTCRAVVSGVACLEMSR